MKNNENISVSFSREIINLVWEKANKVPGYDADLFRKDKFGSWITKNMYGECYESFYFGWYIDYITPKDMGGSDDITNLEPLQWENCSEITNNNSINNQIINV
jgi:hypothetical protein